MVHPARLPENKAMPATVIQSPELSFSLRRLAASAAAKTIAASPTPPAACHRQRG